MASTDEPIISLEDKVVFLGQPRSYPNGPANVEQVETHMSWVFLTDTEAYKLKKPVRRPYLDLKSCEARRLNAERELQLNRRLAGEVYLETAPLCLSPSGAPQMFRGAPVIDWLVRMRRLPSTQMLDTLIRGRATEPEQLDRLIRCLVAFFEACSSQPLSPAVYEERFKDSIESERRHILELDQPISKDDVDRTADRLLAFVARQPEELAARAGRLVEGHGDLRPEHICLLEQPIVIDCLEFSDDLRRLDPAEELAFLAMECELLGARPVGQAILTRYERLAGDSPSPRVIAFYKGTRAMLRARLALQHLSDPIVRRPEHWLQRTRDYLTLAARHGRELADD